MSAEDESGREKGPFGESSESSADSGTERASQDWEIDVSNEPRADEPTADEPTGEPGATDGPAAGDGGGERSRAEESVDPYKPPESTVDPESPDLGPERADVEIFSSRGVGVATFLGGPVAATALMTYNFHEVGWEERVVPTLAIGLFASAAFIGIGYAMPSGTSGMGLVGFAIAIWIANKLNEQIRDRLRDRLGAEPREKSNWTAAGFGCLSFIGTMALVFVVVFLTAIM